MPVETVPELLRTRAPSVAKWEAYLVFKDSEPVAVALGPARVGAKASVDSNWVCVLLDDLASEISVPGYVFRRWKVRKRTDRRGSLKEDG